MSNLPKHDGDPSLDLSDQERAEMLTISRNALTMLCNQPRQTMTLGDFIAELRDLDVGSPMIDEVIVYMAASSWVQLWRHKGSDETWISIAPT